MKQSPVTVSDTQLQNLINSGLNGDSTANDALLAHASERLLRLTRKMFHAYPSLRRWEQTDDVFQNSMLRLHDALAAKQVTSVRHFFNLAGVQIRRELIDLGRHHYGPQGAAKKHHTDHQPSDNRDGALYDQADEPEDLTSWSEFHAEVEKLPEAEQEVVNLLYYEGLSQSEAAQVLGLSLSTIKRRWHTTRLKICEAMTSERTE
jgi:RNA polymerase sigma-70 factor (ECF subfamily)